MRQHKKHKETLVGFHFPGGQEATVIRFQASFHDPTSALLSRRACYVREGGLVFIQTKINSR